jgi:hypothetical protein
MDYVNSRQEKPYDRGTQIPSIQLPQTNEYICLALLIFTSMSAALSEQLSYRSMTEDDELIN